MRRAIILWVAVLATQLAFAQNVQSIKVGDTLPELIFKKMLNYKGSTARISDFAGKPLIIDMWFMECSVCLEAMPHLDSVQTKYRGKINVLLATWQPKMRVEKFWKENGDLKHLKFSQIVEDTLIRKVFPAISFPHQIWIDKNGVVKSINNGAELTDVNIDKLIKGQPFKVELKADEMDANIRNAVLPMISINYEENKNKILEYSYLSKSRKELAGASGYDYYKETGILRAKFLDEHFLNLYHMAYGAQGNPDFKNRFRFPHINRLNLDADFSNPKNFFCFDIMVMDSMFKAVTKPMITALDRGLGFKSHEETVRVLSYVIKRNGKEKKYLKPISEERGPYSENHTLTIDKVWVINKGLVSFAKSAYLNNADKPIQFAFEDSTRLNFSVKWNPKDLRGMNKELARYNLKIAEELVKTKVIVLENQ